MPVNLSVKNVPEPLAQCLRERAERNRRSLQRELLSILEAAVDRRAAPAPALQPPRPTLAIEEVAARARLSPKARKARSPSSVPCAMRGR